MLSQHRRSGHVRGALASLTLVLAHTVLTVLLAIVLARALGPEGYGIYAFALSLATLLATPGSAGMPTLVMREVARYDYLEEWGLIRGLFTRANQAVFVVMLCIIPIAAIIAWIVFGQEETASKQLLTFLWALPLVPLLALGALRGAALRGLRRAVQGQLPELVIRPSLLVVAVASLWYVGSVSPTMAMAMHVLACGGAFFVGGILLLRALPRGVGHAAAAYETQSWARSLVPLSLLAGLQLINNQIGVIALGLLATKEEVGIYRAAVQGATFVSSALIAVNVVVAPHFARLHEARDLDRLQELVRTTSRMILAFALPISSALIGFSGPLLNFVFGIEYIDGRAALAILGLGQLMNAGFGPVAYLLNMTGHERHTVRAIAVGACINVLLLAGLVPAFGLTGAAAATAGTMLLLNVLMWHSVRSTLGIQTLPFGAGGAKPKPTLAAAD